MARPISHGVWSIQMRGEQALNPSQQSRFAELENELSDRAGVVNTLKYAAVMTTLIAEVCSSYVQSEAEKGKGLDEIKILARLPGFWNSANRALRAYLAVFPDAEDVLDLADHIKAAIGDDDEDS